MQYLLNIIGSEWIIIIFIALVLILGTNQLPGAAKKIGKAVSEYNKAKDNVQNQMKDISEQGIEITGPVENDRKKLEAIAKSLGIDPADKTDDTLQKIITEKMGQKKTDDRELGTTK